MHETQPERKYRNHDARHANIGNENGTGKKRFNKAGETREKARLVTISLTLDV